MNPNEVECPADRHRGKREGTDRCQHILVSARRALNQLPEAIANEIRTQALEICQFGCSLGDASPELAASFPGSPLAKMDASSTPQVGRTFDVVFCSDALQDFIGSSGPLLKLARAARRYLIMNLAVCECDQASERSSSLDYSRLPIRPAGLHLVVAREHWIACEAPTEGAGRQLLVVYAHPEATGAAALCLSELIGGLDPRPAQTIQGLEAPRNRAGALLIPHDRLSPPHLALAGQAEPAGSSATELLARLDQARESEGALRADLIRLAEEKLSAWQQAEARREEVERLKEEKRVAVEHLESSNANLSQIYESQFYRFAAAYYRWRDRAQTSAMAGRAGRLIQRMRRRGGAGDAREAVAASASPGAVTAPAAPQQRAMASSASHVAAPHPGVQMLKPIAVTVIDRDFSARSVQFPFSLVMTIKNEAGGIIEFLESIERQTVSPQEVIIVDGGSTDGTVQKVAAYARRSRLPIQLIEAPGSNIAMGRNRGIESAGNELLVLTDAGCKLHRDFCKNLVGCYEVAPDVDLVGGIYGSTRPNAFLMTDWSQVDWNGFLPSARSLAVRRSLVLQMGGFPEYLTLTGEDTLFDVSYRRVSRHWVFNRKSLIWWNAPTSPESAQRVAHSYGKGDGESGIGDYRFASLFQRLVKEYPYGAVGGEDPIDRSFALGYLEGRQRRAEVEVSRRNVPGIVLILSVSHIASPGNCDAETALRLLSQGFKVVFVNVEPFHGEPRWFDIDYTLLELYAASDFNWEEFLVRYAGVADRVFVLYPVYHPALGALVERLKAKTGNLLKFPPSVEEIQREVAARPAVDPARPQVTSTRPSNGVEAPGAPAANAPAAEGQNPDGKSLDAAARFWSISKQYGVLEAVRRSQAKLEKMLPKLTGHRPSPILADGRISRQGAGRSYDIISFPIMPWFSRFQRSQQLVTRFAAHGTRVFRVDRDFLAEEGEAYRQQGVHENVLQVTLAASRPLSIYTDEIDAASLERMLQSFESMRVDWNVGDAVCIVELPFWYPLVKELRARYGWKIVYDCMDEHEGFSTNEGQMVSKEAELARESALVVVTSQYLQKKMSPLNRRCELVRNATDFEHFRRRPAEDLCRGVPRPIVGYYGAISEWFDQELVAHVSKELSHCTFVLIGGNDADISLATLQGLPNVRLLGEKPYADLPKFLHSFDVCIIPFKLGKLMEATNPVKFYEYLSAGKPVVSVMLPELLPYREHAYLAEDRDDFAEKVARALEERGGAARDARIALARQNTWEDRYKLFRGAVDALFPKVSIVIVTYNNRDLTRRCVDSIYARSQYPNFELVIVDNASKDGTAEYLRELAAQRDSVKIVLNDENRGFAGGNNQGLSQAHGDIIVLLNNDTVVTPGWLSKLIRHLEDPAVGMVGPATNMCGNESIIHVPYDVATLEGLDGFVQRYSQMHPLPESFDIDMLSMFCVALRKGVVEEIGPLDERFRVGMFEDTDYAERLKQAGYRIVSARDVYVHHDCKSSFGKLPNAEYHRIYEENRRKFEEKWGRKSVY